MFLPSSIVFLFIITNTFSSYESDHLLGRYGFSHVGDEYYKACGVELLQWAHNVCSNCQSEMEDHDVVFEFSNERRYYLDHKKIAELCCEVSKDLRVSAAAVTSGKCAVSRTIQWKPLIHSPISVYSLYTYVRV
ncbi:hypothetical protein PRIPAC_96309 [Pristionchus pacificus]|uniref:Uncharacterized protein n=1 Tax=Pristionchus pacificus TaxID=54126 RepID=A0A2A6BC83_PRIPA|nr:hypothetical protein PRIPAC_96309 [Pristionchus pacificus]|eukprot:PDM63490.1 hypothetical protein PRIPAC_53847 [Pristionchus pacificus]